MPLPNAGPKCLIRTLSLYVFRASQLLGTQLDCRISKLDRNAFPLTREAALSRMEGFLPLAGEAYARKRNVDLGANSHVHVSRLSAALRRRLISEEELLAAVVAEHGPDVAEKFISEVFWRTYWKGWLEQRPGVWAGYKEAVERAKQRLEGDRGLASRYTDACDGRTGIDCFDAWSQELQATEYLHNWARMQFASIWIFTLGLPWELGADFMLERLVDGDQASYTLSWRWVAGLHTSGKPYLANAERVQATTGGRFAPIGLATRALIPLDNVSIPDASPPRLFALPDPSCPTTLLLTVVSLETLAGINALDIQEIAVMPGETDADRLSLGDALVRARLRWPNAAVIDWVDITSWSDVKASGRVQIVTGFAAVGPTADRLEKLKTESAAQGIALAEHLRDWDRRTWPHCRKGFFHLREKIPSLLIRRGRRV